MWRSAAGRGGAWVAGLGADTRGCAHDRHDRSGHIRWRVATSHGNATSYANRLRRRLRFDTRAACGAQSNCARLVVMLDLVLFVGDRLVLLDLVIGPTRLRERRLAGVFSCFSRPGQIAVAILSGAPPALKKGRAPHQSPQPR